MIKLEHVSKSYSAGTPALNDVNLEIDDGEFVFIVGDSGSGKSTLIRLLLKELEPTEGKITINGKVLGRIKHKQLPKYRRKIGVVFQDFRLLKDRNVFDNVAFAQNPVAAVDIILRLSQQDLMPAQDGVFSQHQQVHQAVFPPVGITRRFHRQPLLQFRLGLDALIFSLHRPFPFQSL